MTYASAANNAGKQPRGHDILEQVRGTKNQPTDLVIRALTREFSTLTREKCHGSSRPDPHETRISLVTRIVAGRVWSGGEDFKTSRVRSGRVRNISNLAGRVGSGQEVFKLSGVGSGRVKTSRNSHGSGHVSSPNLTRPNPQHLTRPVKSRFVRQSP